ncbi:two-component sensor histidine kinase [Arcticibacter svalbardensis MN12-7]|uniref:histidine kinase n=1 Tax=Arcticibacter svalbardensis MN12-7 TaxID=1150600 RepID=R9GMV7_9SPHI|nr:7TM diverse intracellular signaling domain-containing protein [Arcticibacter svalbardensis]EOR92880.1 two-component sensor histidine kinase [Arcticibacter svalbardensis MN12-7]
MINRISAVFLFLFFTLNASFAQQVLTFKGELAPIGDRVEILTDSNSTMSLRSALSSKEFKRSSGSQFPNLGTTPYSYWIRFTLKNESNSKAMGIQLTQSMMDYVDFYQVQGDSVTRTNFTGHRRPFNNRFVKHQTYIYQVPIIKGESQTIYLKVKSGKQLTLPIYVGSIEEVVENAMIIDLLFGIYLGIIMVMLLYNLFIYFSIRDITYLYYVSYLGIVMLTQASMQGYIFRFILPAYPEIADMFIYISTSLIGIAAIEFSKHFLSSKQYTPLLHRISYIFWALYGIQISLAIAGFHNFSYTMMLALAMVSAVYVLYMAVVIMLKGFRPAKFFLIAWTGFIFCVIIYVLKDFDLIFHYNNITNFTLLIGSAFEAIMLSFALADKINILKVEKEQSQLETLKALQENERIIKEQNVVLEARVIERTSELHEANEELNSTLENLKQTQSQLVESEKMASLGQLTAGIAHEINNPINFVTSNINPLKRDIDILLAALDEIEIVGLSDSTISAKQLRIKEYKEELDFDYLKVEINQLVKGINEGASRTAEIVKGLRVFSRLDEDDLKKADINQCLDSTMIIANNQLNNNIKVIMEYGELPLVECYAGKLNQVFLNIIINGIHAIHTKFGSTSGGELKIATYADEENVFINIYDNGIGMGPETQKKIFEPFFTTKDVGEGTGLGMSIAYNTIKKHKGQISVMSSPGEGSQFSLQIPIHNNQSLSHLN